MSKNIKRIVITPGEPAGIGPDICLSLASYTAEHELLLIADPELIKQRAKLCRTNVDIEIVDPNTPPAPAKPGQLKLLPVALHHAVTPGTLNKSNASYVLETLKIATQLCLKGKADALVTGPVQKSVINEAGIPFTGHTEFLAELSHTAQVVMMLAIPGLRIALATTHLPLAQVAENITPEKLEQVIRILHGSLKNDFGITQPEIMVCGLNPHAGEDGHLGDEEIRIIKPVMEKLKKEHLHLTGPAPADTAFVKSGIEKYDAFLAMYHDQGLPVLKHLGFGKAVNITLGLPFIRTSVDHGTALALAGSGKADANSLHYAIDVAIEMSRHRGRQ